MAMTSPQDWIGHSREAEDQITERMAMLFDATLAPHLAPRPEGAAALGLHWCLAPDAAPMEGLGADGHPARGDFLPPIALPRRMWASGSLRLHDPLRVGDVVRRRSEIAKIDEKTGRAGPLCFVTVRHVLETVRGRAVEEDQVIVYRGAGPGTDAPRGAAPPPPPPPPEALARVVEVGEPMLFRYSALTFNAHRIHYDEPYATQIEGYGGLVVHGPLQATLLLNHAARRAGRAPASFSFRGRRAAVGVQRLTLAVESDAPMATTLSIRDQAGLVTMTADAAFCA